MNRSKTRRAIQEGTLEYYCRSFVIESDWDGGDNHTFTVIRSKDKKVIEVLETMDPDVDFDLLKTKHILDLNLNFV